MPTTLSDFTIHAAADGRCEWETPEDLCGADALLPVLRDAVEGGEDIELYEGLVAGAPPGGMVRRDAYEHMRDSLLADLRRAHEGQGRPCDAVLLALHGAFVAFGIDDIEGDILSRARDIVGEDVLLAATLDPHSHLTQRRFEAADLLVAWKEFPHVDIEERSRELVSLTLRSLRREVRPVMAKHDCRMITSLPTTQPAIREFVDKCMATERHSEMSSLSTLDVHPGELNAESDSIQSAGATHSPPSAVQAGATRASCRFRS